MDQELISQFDNLCKRNFFSVNWQNNLRSNGELAVFFGKTCVHCAVYGPKPCTMRSQEKNSLSVAVKLRGDPSMPEDKLQFIQETCEKLLLKIICVDEYPFTGLTIDVTVMNDSGNLLTAIVNSCMLGLLVNGIKLVGTAWALNFNLSKDDLELYPECLKKKQYIKDYMPKHNKDAMDLENGNESVVDDVQKDESTEVFMTIELGQGNLLQLIVLDELSIEDYEFLEGLGKSVKNSITRLIKAT